LEISFAVDLIQEAYRYKYDALGAQGEGFTRSSGFKWSYNTYYASGYIAEDRISSYLGRLSYNFKEKYFVEGSFRRDGSSRFNPDVRWGSFMQLVDLG
jgi:hypothetical protein